MERNEPIQRDGSPHLQWITTRWSDNDVYGHVNNVVYFSYFDTVVNQYRIEKGVLDIHGGEVIGLWSKTPAATSSRCSFPTASLPASRSKRLGTSSVVYRIGLFRNELRAPAAQGRFVHVYIDRATRKPVPLPAALRDALAPLLGAD